MNVFTNGDNTLQHDEELIPCSKESTPKVARTVPRVNFLGTEVFARSQPLLRWGEKDNRGITSSGWNPLNGASVCFSDKSASDGEINIIIEPPAPGFALSVAAVICVPYWPLLFKAISTRAVAHGYFFKKNAESGIFFDLTIHQNVTEVSCRTLISFYQRRKNRHDSSM